MFFTHMAWRCDNRDWVCPLEAFTDYLVDNCRVVKMPHGDCWYYIQIPKLKALLEHLAVQLLEDPGQY
jgi:hypothetical protein